MKHAMKPLTFDEWKSVYGDFASRKYEILNDEYGDAGPFSEPTYVNQCFEEYLVECEMEEWREEFYRDITDLDFEEWKVNKI